MTVDFFEKATCKSNSKRTQFGLFDDGGLQASRIDENDPSTWIAEVSNPQSQSILHLAVDNCIEMKDAEGKMLSRCDSILYNDQQVVFVELKERRPKNNEWKKKGVSQLKKTVQTLQHNHSEWFRKRKKRAVFANKKRPNFESGHFELKEKFERETGVRLFLKRKIEW